MPTGMHLGKVTVLTMALCKLHNFCIDEEGGLGKSKQAVAPVLAEDELCTQLAGASPLSFDEEGRVIADDLTGAGHHSFDHGRSLREPPMGYSPRSTCLAIVRGKGLKRKLPSEWGSKPTRSMLAIA
jgi:hypothetical protein